MVKICDFQKNISRKLLGFDGKYFRTRFITSRPFCKKNMNCLLRGTYTKPEPQKPTGVDRQAETAADNVEIKNENPDESMLAVDDGTLDRDCSQTGHNVYDSEFDVIKHEVCSDSSGVELQSGCRDTPATTRSGVRRPRASDEKVDMQTDQSQEHPGMQKKRSVSRSILESNKAQIKYLCQYMAKHPELAKTPISASDMNVEWAKLKKALDTLGQNRSVYQWKICWRDQKWKARDELRALSEAKPGAGSAAAGAAAEAPQGSRAPWAQGVAGGCGPDGAPAGPSPAPRPARPARPARRRARSARPANELNDLMKELIKEVRRGNDLNQQLFNYFSAARGGAPAGDAQRSVEHDDAYLTNIGSELQSDDGAGERLTRRAGAGHTAKWPATAPAATRHTAKWPSTAPAAVGHTAKWTATTPAATGHTAKWPATAPAATGHTAKWPANAPTATGHTAKCPATAPAATSHTAKWPATALAAMGHTAKRPAATGNTAKRPATAPAATRNTAKCPATAPAAAAADVSVETPQGYDFQWTTLPNPPTPPESRRETFSNSSVGPLTACTDPYETFTAIWDRRMMERIASETNRYAQQLSDRDQIRSWSDTTADELYVHFALTLGLGYVVKVMTDSTPVPVHTFHWPGFDVHMSFTRFQLLNTCLHFNNNEVMPALNLDVSESKLFKIQPVVEHLNDKFQQLYNLSRNIVIDESLLQQRSSQAQGDVWQTYTTGIESYELCEAQSGYVWRFVIQKTPRSRPPTEEFASAIVLKLIRGLEHKGHTLFMDSFFNFPALARKLKGLGVDCVGTLRTNRRHVPDSLRTLDKDMMREGEVCARTAGDVDALVWRRPQCAAHGPRRMALLSTYHGAALADLDDVTAPAAFVHYRNVIRSLNVRYLMLHASPFERTLAKGGYKKLFRKLLNVSAWNANILCQSSGLDHKTFRGSLIESILEKHSKYVP